MKQKTIESDENKTVLNRQFDSMKSNINCVLTNSNCSKIVGMDDTSSVAHTNHVNCWIDSTKWCFKSEVGHGFFDRQIKFYSWGIERTPFGRWRYDRWI